MYCLRLAHPKERQNRTRLVDRQTDTKDLIREGDDDFDSKLTASRDTRRSAKLISGSMNLVGHQNITAALRENALKVNLLRQRLGIVNKAIGR